MARHISAPRLQDSGLREMPGNEELLELQRSALASFCSEK
jgi:hypothetical protein